MPPSFMMAPLKRKNRLLSHHRECERLITIILQLVQICPNLGVIRTIFLGKYHFSDSFSDCPCSRPWVFPTVICSRPFGRATFFCALHFVFLRFFWSIKQGWDIFVQLFRVIFETFRLSSWTPSKVGLILPLSEAKSSFLCVVIARICAH